jgi:hypothetical protein
VKSGNAISELKMQGYYSVRALQEQPPTVEELKELGFTLYEAKTMNSELSTSKGEFCSLFFLLFKIYIFSFVSAFS